MMSLNPMYKLRRTKKVKMAHSFQAMCWFLSWPFSLHARASSISMTKLVSSLFALLYQLDLPPKTGEATPVCNGGGLVIYLLRIHVYVYMERG